MENGYPASDIIVRYQVINRQFLAYPTIFGKYINPRNKYKTLSNVLEKVLDMFSSIMLVYYQSISFIFSTNSQIIYS